MIATQVFPAAAVRRAVWRGWAAVFRCCAGVLLLLLAAAGAAAFDAPSAAEIRQAHRWAESAFGRPPRHGGAAPAAAASSRLVVLRKSHQVLLGRTVWDSPLTLGSTSFAHGIYMDAPAAVEIQLAQPAAEFTARVGIDNNADTRRRPAAGSARFHVVVDGQRAYSSPVLRWDSPARPVRVPLQGRKRFRIEVDDGGDGRGWDQCTWAEARVRLADGSVQYLDQLPLRARRRTRVTTLPFAFTYGGRPAEELLGTWGYSFTTRQANGRRERVVSYTCDESGLVLDFHVTTYADVPAIDWVCRLRNTGRRSTEVIEDLLPLNACLLELGSDAAVTLRWSEGDDGSPTSFMPHDDLLRPGALRSFAPSGGRSSNGAGGGALPFFNLAGTGGGWVLAVGWSGQWTVEFARRPDGRVLAAAGMETTRFVLKPGESVRSPRIVLVRYLMPDMARGHNLFRRMMRTHYVPRRDGEPVVPPICHNTAATVYRSGQEATERNQLAIIDKAARLGCEAYWMDAYWYPRPWHAQVGSWFPRPADFPHGLRPLADAAHEAGMQFVLWFEPERVAPGTDFDRRHARFLLTRSGASDRLWNLGDPAGRQRLTDFLSHCLSKWDVDVFRNDFNVDPLPYWRAHDARDRQGVTEMRYVEGLYRMWGELRARHPHLQIDNCASGGRRIDIELCRLSWPLWRSDRNDIGEGLRGPEHWPRMALADQIHMSGLALYLPYQAGPVWDMHPYTFRSAMTSSIVLYERIRDPQFPDALARQAIGELKSLRPLFQGDFFPLMPITASQQAWYAYQLHRPDLGQGCALAFRRPDSPDSEQCLRLRQIDPQATYRVTVTGESYESGPERAMRGQQLAEWSVRIDSKPGSALIRYTRVAQDGQ